MFLGIDLGTSSVKVLLIDDAQKSIDSVSVHLKVNRPEEGWSEQDPEEWYRATLSAVDTLREKHPQEFAKIIGIGLSGQMHGLVMLGRNNEVLYPAILWNDGRSGTECSELEKKHPEFITITGNRVMPGFTAPKLQWIRKHRPEIFQKIHRVLLPKDYLRFRLSGSFYSEMSDAAGTLWLDVKERAWSQDLLRAGGLEVSQLPELTEGCEPAGELKPELSESWGVKDRPVIAGGGGDNAASACGIGAISPGDAFLSLGTSGVLWATTSEFKSDPHQGVHAFCHALPNTWHQMAVILSAMDGLSWISEISGKSPAELTKNLAPAEAGPGGPIFLPYLSGERTPHNNPNIRGSLVGLARKHDLQIMVRSILEGITFAFKDCLDVLKESGNAFDVIPLIGGGGNIANFPEIIASILNVKILLPENGDYGAALGAARLAMVASGNSDFARIFSKPQTERIVEPNPVAVQTYRDAYEKFRELCAGLL